MCSRHRELERKKEKEKMSKKKTRKILEKIAKVMGLRLVVDEYFVFFAKRDEKEMHQLSPAYRKDILETFLERCVFKAEKFWEGIANPFYGCRSAEEALVRIDLLEGMRLNAW